MTGVPSSGARFRRRSKLLVVGVAAVTLFVVGLRLTPAVSGAWIDGPVLLRVATHVPAMAHVAPHPLVLTLGGPVYCGQVRGLARRLGASLLCPDYGRDGELSGASRARRVEDWGDPRYLDAVARLPAQLREEGVKISELILVGASYAGYAVAELAATHPELRPRALIIVDGFLDLPARFRALVPGQATRSEMIRVLGGTLGMRRSTYEERSPSNHLDGLALDVRRGMRLVDVWSLAPSATREFRGAMCSLRSNVFWLHRLASILNRPVTGYVTRMRHAYALWYWWADLVRLADLAPGKSTMPARAIILRGSRPIPSGSYCRTDRGD